jgi:pimeloyl-ACP methyl ester carboxylesterase
MNMQEVQLNGASFAFREGGRGDPVVLVHANLSDMRSWAPLEPLLARQFRVINYSRRFAHPNPPIEPGADDSLLAHATDLIALTESLGLGKVHLVGNSSGAFICLLAARQRPDLARTLTLEEPPVVSMFLQALPPKPGEMLQLLLSSPATFLDFASFGAGTIGPATKAFRQGRNDLGLEIFARGVVGPAAYDRVSPARRRQMIDNVLPHRAALLGSGLPAFMPSDAAAIRIPTQLLHGSDTPRFQRRINRRLAELIPGACDVCIPNASHLVHEDNPQVVARTILDFCRAR